MASIQKRTLKNGETLYTIRVYSRKDGSGKDVYESTSWKPDPKRTDKQNQKALELFVTEFEQKVKNGMILAGEKITFGEFVGTWMKDHCAVRLAQKTIEGYQYNLERYILPELAPYKMADIKPYTLTKIYNKLSQRTKKNGEPLSASTVQRCRKIVSSIFKTAVKWDVIPVDVSARSEAPPAVPTTGEKAFTIEQATTFLDGLEKAISCEYGERTRYGKDGNVYKIKPYEANVDTASKQMKLFFYLALFCGCRRGEILALTWKDVDFIEKEVTISKNTVALQHGRQTKQPKTPSGNRTISCPDIVIDLLSEWKTEQKETMLTLGTAWEGLRGADFDRNFIFITATGRQMHPESPTKAFRKTIARINATLPPDEQLPKITLHGLRHTSATLSIAEGADIVTTSKRLGHSKVSTTLDIYAHALKTQDRKIADSLQNALIGGSQ